MGYVVICDTIDAAIRRWNYWIFMNGSRANRGKIVAIWRTVEWMWSDVCFAETCHRVRTTFVIGI